MSKKLIIGIVILLLLGAGVLWWMDEGQEEAITPPSSTTGYIDPATLQVGDEIGVFTIESIEKSTTEDGNPLWRIQLRGEKVVRGRYVVIRGPGDQLDDGEVALYLDDADDEPLIPKISDSEIFALRIPNLKPSEFETYIPGGYEDDFTTLEMRIADPFLSNRGTVADTRMIEVVSKSRSPQGRHPAVKE